MTPLDGMSSWCLIVGSVVCCHEEARVGPARFTCEGSQEGMPERCRRAADPETEGSRGAAALVTCR